MHLFFGCPRVRKIWENLGILAIIDEACTTDRVGSAILEFLLRKNDMNFPSVEGLGMKELIVSACWYMWWERRRISRDEPVQRPARTSQAILVMALNFFKLCKQTLGIRRHGWEKPSKGFVKLNVDAAFSTDNFTRTQAHVTCIDRF
jgi:hypothetical protein